jgi:dTDP-4-amino-4,6-dideoxygalactose transaminase
VTRASEGPTAPPAIPLVDLRAQYAEIRAAVVAAMQGTLERADFIQGEELFRFEEEFAAYCGAAHAVGCASGTDAIQLLCRAMGIASGDEVIIPAMTFVATALGVAQAGARPVLVDVDPDTGLMDPDQAEAAITPRTRAILPVHLYGQCVDAARFRELAARRRLVLLEDAAQAHGATSGGIRAGAIGIGAAFSFYPGKNLGAYGDGGCVTTSDAAVARRLRSLGNWGSPEKYRHDEMGLNSRLDTLQAAILRVKLARLDAWNAARRRLADAYTQALADLPSVRLTRYNDGAVYHLYVIRLGSRDAVLRRLQAAGIGAGIHYPHAVHQQRAYGWLGYAPGAFPVAEDFARHCLSVPIYPEMPPATVARVAGVLRAPD